MEKKPRKGRSARNSLGPVQVLGTSTPVDIDAVNPRSEWGEYVDCYPEHLWKRARHWQQPGPDGTTRTVAEQFRELEREGKVCLYFFIEDAAREVYGPIHEIFMRSSWNTAARWSMMNREHGEMMAAFAQLEQRLGRYDAQPHGVSYKNAHHRLNHGQMVRHVLTPEEKKENEAVGYLGSIEHRTGGQVRTPIDRVGVHWVDTYAAEVRQLLGEEPDPDYIAAFNELHQNLKAFQIGTKEGAPLMDRLRREAKGEQVLAAFERCQSRLLLRLKEIADEHSAAPVGPVAMDKRFVWEGTIASFACIMRDAVAKGWIEMPSDLSWDEFAERSRTLFYFQGNKGKEASLGSVKEAMNKVDGGVTTKWVAPLKALPQVDAYRGRGGGKTDAEVSTGTLQK